MLLHLLLIRGQTSLALLYELEVVHGSVVERLIIHPVLSNSCASKVVNLSSDRVGALWLRHAEPLVIGTS